MKESRKFGLHVTLAQQIYGESMTPKMREIVSGNTAVKITAKNADKSLRAFAANTGTELELLKSLKKYEYLIQSGDSLPVKYRITAKTMGSKNSMTREEWKVVLENQIASFYRPTTKPGRRERTSTNALPPCKRTTSKTNPIGNFGRKPPVSKS